MTRTKVALREAPSLKAVEEESRPWQPVPWSRLLLLLLLLGRPPVLVWRAATAADLDLGLALVAVRWWAPPQLGLTTPAVPPVLVWPSAEAAVLPVLPVSAAV